MGEHSRHPICRTRGRGLRQVAEDLRGCVPDRKANFRLAQTSLVMLDLDEWLRHWLRAVRLKQWRRGTTICRKLRRPGARVDLAARIAGNEYAGGVTAVWA